MIYIPKQAVFNHATIEWHEKSEKIAMDHLEDAENARLRSNFHANAREFVSFHVQQGQPILTIREVSLEQGFCEVSLCDYGAELHQLKEPSDGEKKIWSTVKTLIPTFGDEKNIKISHSFVENVFAPIIPDSPFLDLARHERIAFRIIGLVILVLEIPFRALGVFIFCRAMDIYSFSNPDFAEYYRFRAKINTWHPARVLSRSIIKPLDDLCS